jgi:predicted SprT family Zn-dependent metalloprotease
MKVTKDYECDGCQKMVEEVSLQDTCGGEGYFCAKCMWDDEPSSESNKQ